MPTYSMAGYSLRFGNSQRLRAFLHAYDALRRDQGDKAAVQGLPDLARCHGAKEVARTPDLER